MAAAAVVPVPQLGLPVRVSPRSQPLLRQVHSCHMAQRLPEPPAVQAAAAAALAALARVREALHDAAPVCPGHSAPPAETGAD